MVAGGTVVARGDLDGFERRAMNPSRGGRRQLPATPGSPPMGSPNGYSPRMDDFENYVVLRPLGDKDNTVRCCSRARVCVCVCMDWCCCCCVLLLGGAP